jgi:alpha-glutamyl/putrescinyl thymine pyrophosphorylase-like protein
VIAVTQTFCRHNRFIQRCPICRKTVPGIEPERPAAKAKRQTASGARAGGKGGGASTRAGAAVAGSAARTSTRRAPELRVHREQRSEDDGYRCELVPGLHSSKDAARLAQEIGFASARLLALSTAPPALYAEARDCDDIEQATWICFLAAYLSPLQGEQPFAGIRQALLASWASGAAPDLQDVPLGPRSSHDPARGAQTLVAYRRFAEHAGSQERAFAGEPEWTPQRRFERVFERLALPGFGRVGRYDLLVTLGRLGLYELRGDSLHLSTRASGPMRADPTPEAAKRVLGIGDTLLVERRALALAEALSVPLEALDLALWNWSLPPEEQRTTLGFPASMRDEHALARALAALEL